MKLAAVATDVTGTSARAMLAALVAGEADPQVLAALAQGRLREKLPQLEQALHGQFGVHQRFLVARQLAHLGYLDGLLAELDAEVTARLAPFAPAVARLQTIDGWGQRTAEVVLAEVGADMPVPDGRTPDFLVGDVSRAAGERRQTPERQDA